MWKKILAVLLTAVMVVSIASCGKPDGGVSGSGTAPGANYAGKSTETIEVNHTWYPTMSGSVPFSSTDLYIVATENAQKVQINSDGSVTGLQSGLVTIEFYRGNDQVAKMQLQITGF